MMSRAIFLLAMACLVGSSPPPDPIKCTTGATNCTVTNGYGIFPDRSTCRAANATYPTTEQQLVAAIAAAVATKTKIKSVSRTAHSIPKLSCPGGDNGLLISTKLLNKVVSVDAPNMLMTVEAGMTLKELIEAAAAAGLALPHSPYWWGVTVGGLLATGSHGSSLMGKGSAVHEYVVGVRIVTPTTSANGYAVVRSINAGNPEIDAVKVSLGVLGVISQVTFQLQPLFKRSISYVTRNDTNLANKVAVFGNEHEFADITWYPGHSSAVYRIDDRVSNTVVGNGSLDFIGFRPKPTVALLANRLIEEGLEETSSSKCPAAAITTALLATAAYGLKNNPLIFTGYPVIGSQNKLQASGSCLVGPEDALLTACAWDPRIIGQFYFQTTFSIAISKVRDFILDVQKLRDVNPEALCGVELYGGILMRYVKASTAFMGNMEDSLNFDITYYRSYNASVPRLHEEVLEEVEQMALYKYGALPHWGKNRNLAFDGVIGKYGGRRGEFLKVKDSYDPEGLFSNEWTDQVLGIKGNTSIYRAGCALEGLCVCSEDLHCAPERRYLCRPGKVYTEARVCRFVQLDFIM